MGQKGAFILGQVHNKQMTLTHPVAVSTSSLETGFYNSWEINPTSGKYVWMAQGSSLSSVDRIDVSNDLATASARGAGNVVRSDHAGVSNFNYGWYGGGKAPTTVSTVERTDFSNDSIVQIYRGPLSSARYGVTGNSTINYGWFTAGAPASSTRDRIDFSNDIVVASARGVNAISQQYSVGLGNANYGWAAGGQSPLSSYVIRADYSADLSTSLIRTGRLSIERYASGAGSNPNYGWVFTGAGPGSVVYSTTDRIDFSNDLTTALVRGSASLAKYIVGSNNNSNFAWVGGGGTITPSTTISTVDRLEFANDTAAGVVRGPLSTTRQLLASTANYVNTQPIYNPPNSDTFFGYGWTVFGQAPGVVSASMIDRIDFSNDSVAALYRQSSSGNTAVAGTNNSNYGWQIGGQNFSAPATYYSYVYKLDYSNDINNVSLRGPLSVASAGSASVGNANFGYSTGGTNGTVLTYVNRIDYANDLSSSLLRGNVVQAASLAAGVSTPNYGWQIGQGSNASRIDFSNDVLAASARTNVSGGLGAAGASSRNYGYFTYGALAPLNSAIYRFDYSNDTAATPPQSSSLSVAKYSLRGTGNSNYGYFTGGYVLPAAYLSTVDRLIYATDTIAASARGPLTQTRINHAAISNFVQERQLLFYGNTITGTFAKAVGGNTYAPNVALSSTDRIDFGNDSVTASARNILATTRQYAASLSNQFYGWTAHGTGYISSVERSDFSNDLAKAVARGFVINGRGYVGSVSSANYGWFLGGYTPGGTYYSTIERLQFADDSVNTSFRAALDVAKSYVQGASNSDFGWMIGAFSPAYPAPGLPTSIFRISFANDAVAPLQRGSMVAGRYNVGISSNQTYLWTSSGRSPSNAIQADTQRLDLANDTVNTVSRGAANASRMWHAAGGNKDFGWHFGGGYANGLSTVIRIDYASDNSTASTRGNLNTGRNYVSSQQNYVKTPPNTNVSLYNKGTATAGTQGAASYGYSVSGGSPIVSTIDRIDFSNDGGSSTARGTVPVAISYHTGVSNAYYGWAIGGQSPALISTVSRIDYSNDNIASTVRGPMPDIISKSAAVQNANYGWTVAGMYSGSNSTISTAFRIDYSTDNVASTVRSYSVLPTWYSRGLSTPMFGWAVGGMWFPPGTQTAAISRLNFGNDTANLISRGTLIATRYGTGTIGTQTYGWSAGGTQPTVTTVERINYSNDTVTAIIRGPLVVAAFGQSTFGNNSYGWFAGGGPTLNGATNRMDYSNDSATTVARGTMTGNRYYATGVSNHVK